MISAGQATSSSSSSSWLFSGRIRCGRDQESHFKRSCLGGFWSCLVVVWSDPRELLFSQLTKGARRPRTLAVLPRIPTTTILLQRLPDLGHRTTSIGSQKYGKHPKFRQSDKKQSSTKNTSSTSSPHQQQSRSLPYARAKESPHNPDCYNNAPW